MLDRQVIPKIAGACSCCGRKMAHPNGSPKVDQCAFRLRVRVAGIRTGLRASGESSRIDMIHNALRVERLDVSVQPLLLEVVVSDDAHRGRA